MSGKNRRPMDYTLMIATLVLVVYGLIMVFSASYYKAQSSALYDYDGLYLFKRQAIGAVIGLAALLFFSWFDYRRLLKLKYAILIASFILLAVVFIPGIGIDRNGSSRWIQIGPLPAFQPAEIAKLAMIIFTAATIYVNRLRMDQFRYGILPNLLVLIPMCLLLFLQPNFSSVIMLCLLVFIMMYVGGAKGKQLALLAGLGGLAGFGMLVAEEYRENRILAFLDPWSYAQGGGLQVIQSLYGIGAGGLTGRGLGNSRQKLLWLPYGESDFIYSITAEEFGFIGSCLLIGLFILIVYRGVCIAASAPDLFGTVVASGITSLIGVQAIMNIAVATASMPVTGVPMPLFSYGSSSLVIFMAMVGILLNISRQSSRIVIRSGISRAGKKEAAATQS